MSHQEIWASMSKREKLVVDLMDGLGIIGGNGDYKVCLWNKMLITLASMILRRNWFSWAIDMSRKFELGNESDITRIQELEEAFNNY